MKKSSFAVHAVWLSACLFVAPALSHDIVESHDCIEPARSTSMASMIEQELFQAQLAVFESCMFDFIRAQQRQAGIHEQSAQIALDEWATFFQP